MQKKESERTSLKKKPRFQRLKLLRNRRRGDELLDTWMHFPTRTVLHG